MTGRPDPDTAELLERARRLKRRVIALRPSLAPGVGDPESYAAVHSRLQRRRGSAWGWACVDCGEHAEEWSYDGGDPDERVDAKGRRYSLDLSRYVPRCVPCHRRLDRRKPDPEPDPEGSTE
ncbi:hypothetical protein [Nocardioides sp. KR10-350]|uniref:hypothetical protein n=1 Tax=Nocardioides cheoyonin TaxID=3156615 RepID=UPI0032B4F6C1